MGEGNTSWFRFREKEGRAFTKSVVTLTSARPAGINSEGSMIWPWNVIFVFLRLSWRRTCSIASARQVPPLSPAITILEAGTFSCGELGGGARRER